MLGIIAGILLICLIVKCVSRLTSEDIPRNPSAQAELDEYEAEIAHKQRLMPQRNLIKKYGSSHLLPEILQALHVDRRQLPEEITIYDDRIQATTNGQTRSYRFAEHRVPFLTSVEVEDRAEEFTEDFLRPQVAMAEAINQLLGKEYDIMDNAIRDRDNFWIRYKSNYVLMRLKATKSF